MLFLLLTVLHNSAKITVRPYIPISMITTGWSDGAREDRRSIIYRSDSERQTVYKGRDSSPQPKAFGKSFFRQHHPGAINFELSSLPFFTDGEV